VGQVLQGTVSKLVPFGAFVRVDAGIEGLVHLRELDRASIEAPEEVVQLGDQVTVVVTEIDVDGRRLSLSRKRAITS
jgi:small subunit ribosomal protein S1